MKILTNPTEAFMNEDINSLIGFSFNWRRVENHWQCETVYQFEGGRQLIAPAMCGAVPVAAVRPGTELVEFLAPSDADPKTFDIERYISRCPTLGMLADSGGAIQTINNWPGAYRALGTSDGGLLWLEPRDAFTDRFLTKLDHNGDGTFIFADVKSWIVAVRKHWGKQPSKDRKNERSAHPAWRYPVTLPPELTPNRGKSTTGKLN